MKIGVFGAMYILGVDIGTTGTKAMLVRDDGRIICRAYKGYPLISLKENCVEQNAEDWWSTLVYAVNECTKELDDKHAVKAISVSAQGGSMVPMDENGACLRNAMVWMDTRGSAEVDTLLSIKGEDWFYAKTGWKLAIGLNAVKIAWLKKNERNIFNKTAKYITTLDYINYKLTGKYVIDPTNAAMTQLMDVSGKAWDHELLELLDIHEDQLPEICSSGSVLGHLTQNTAELLGLDKTVVVVNGGHDQYCGAVGAGAIHEGDILLSTGSAWVVLGISQKPLFENHTYVSVGRHIPDGLWGALSSVPTAGVAMEWFKENLALRTVKDGVLQAEDFVEIDKKAATSMGNAKELFFYPYYSGREFPKWNMNVRASLLGLSLQHNSYDIARATMEGVAFEVNHILESYKGLGCPTNDLRIIGGAARSSLWMKIISNVVGSAIIKFKETDMACIGAAILAGNACGVFDGYEDGSRKIDAGEVVQPSSGAERDFYLYKYEKYKKGIECLDSFYKI